jgi:L-ascorbate metabolism protein UlaG (beta-lactamase superfamily)
MLSLSVQRILTYCFLVLAMIVLLYFILTLYTIKPGNRNLTITEGIGIVKYPRNQTAFKFITSEGVTIITDPYGMDETVAADIVTESHSHSDHADVSRITGDYSLITETGSYDVQGVHIEGYPGVHDDGDESVTNIIFVFEIDGIRIAQCGSQGAVPDEETLEQIGDIDILIIQFMDYYTKMSPDQASQVARALNAKIIIPAHGDPEKNDEFAELLPCAIAERSIGKLIITR